ncbi:NAD(P)-dependent alcohol dehydrogenase [Burkholderia cenocepacia]|uniref:D-xylulose reductase n=1 Tax=Burkholderia cenocepacia (strain ATCC BAA-245 / DSM 16553 / LMG 16656 / NCTC 13227 / J2315 / CF5610) TaxID=216591 RepID=B4EGM1_BURCJ|nr:NAD(P)-dependent alcohol dehydrogenase [Burkholderia cenocepacia]KIS50649.1 zinc-binding dehydrogenase family protein [Burkholderia cepacia]EPZ90576.1 putative chlorophyll synthesis pathway protein BchC [Burkholderia cenocepacia K56-2Valvano]ERI24741.1 putative chlorophyll synthesis pathway protein BchC [Burkholderia cenocepacia BC7]KKI80800.1 sulfurtransferase [Burkholderia cenocepacia]MCW3662376.1 NAD(P)-dependent alcohol dehydrogenase [Burkholderia cenocepacia]
MKALVLERTRELALRDIDLPQAVGPVDVRIKVHTVGVCGSDVHYYVHGGIGPFRVDAPMVLGHEASGTVVETGAGVTHLRVGDRVCMEPGVPRLDSPATLRGLYNLDPDVRFWATPPIHGCLTPFVVHPAAFTYRLPDNVSFAEGAIVEPLSIGLQAAKKAAMKPGDLAVVIGAGTIGAMTALAALAGGAARVILADVVPDKLALFAGNPAVTTVDVRTRPLADAVAEASGGWGADVVFEASGSANAYAGLVDLMCPGGCAVLIGMPVAPVPLDVVALQAKEGRIESVFRYANIFPRALALIASGAIDVKPFISRTFPFSEGVRAFEEAASGHPRDVKIQIEMD